MSRSACFETRRPTQKQNKKTKKTTTRKTTATTRLYTGVTAANQPWQHTSEGEQTFITYYLHKCEYLEFCVYVCPLLCSFQLRGGGVQSSSNFDFCVYSRTGSSFLTSSLALSIKGYLISYSWGEPADQSPQPNQRPGRRDDRHPPASVDIPHQVSVVFIWIYK